MSGPENEPEPEVKPATAGHAIALPPAYVVLVHLALPPGGRSVFILRRRVSQFALHALQTVEGVDKPALIAGLR